MHLETTHYLATKSQRFDLVKRETGNVKNDGYS